MNYKDEGEMNYWSLHLEKDKEHIKYYSEVLEYWNVTSGTFADQHTLEIGPGPFGGVLMVIVADSKTAVDPLAQKYVEAGFGDLTTSGFMVINDCFERHDFTGFQYDAIFSHNSLDHGDLGFGHIPLIADLLVPGGRFYLHVHLRTPDQLNREHDHQLKYEDFATQVERSNMRIVSEFQLHEDPLHEIDPHTKRRPQYKTLFAVVEKL